MNRTVLSHPCWVDNMWLFAFDTCTLQTMIDDLTHRLHHDLGMHWKPKSLQIMYAAHVPRKDRNEGHRLAFDPCCSMKVLGSWCDDGGGSSGFGSASRQSSSGKQCVLQTLLDEPRPLVPLAQHRQKGWKGRCLRKVKTFSEWQLGNTPALHEADRGCPEHHLHKERAHASTHQNSTATAQVGTSGTEPAVEPRGVFSAQSSTASTGE